MGFRPDHRGQGQGQDQGQDGDQGQEAGQHSAVEGPGLVTVAGDPDPGIGKDVQDQGTAIEGQGPVLEKGEEGLGLGTEIGIDEEDLDLSRGIETGIAIRTVRRTKTKKAEKTSPRTKLLSKKRRLPKKLRKKALKKVSQRRRKGAIGTKTGTRTVTKTETEEGGAQDLGIDADVRDRETEIGTEGGDQGLEIESEAVVETEKDRKRHQKILRSKEIMIKKKKVLKSVLSRHLKRALTPRLKIWIFLILHEFVISGNKCNFSLCVNHALIAV